MPAKGVSRTTEASPLRTNTDRNSLYSREQRRSDRFRCSRCAAASPALTPGDRPRVPSPFRSSPATEDGPNRSQKLSR